MQERPVILLAFANDHQQYRYKLTEEQHAIREALRPAERAGLCQVVYETDTDLDNKVLLFTLESKRSKIFADYSTDGSRIMIGDSNGNYQAGADPIGSLRAGRYYQLSTEEQKTYGIGPEYR